MSQVAKSVSSDQVGIVYLVVATSLEVERWLCRYQWNLASLPTGWFLGYFVNRFRDVTRLLGRVSGIKGAHYSDKNTLKGKVIAGLIASLFIWLSIFFGVSLIMLIGKFVVQSIGADNTRRISAARTEINTFQDNVLKSFDATTNALPLAQLSTVPTDNKIALGLSYKKIASITNLLSSFNTSLPQCQVNQDFTGFREDSSLVNCQNSVTDAVNKENTPTSKTPLQNQQNQLLTLLSLELESLTDHQQIDSRLSTSSSVVRGTEPGSISAYTNQLQATRNQIIAEINSLRKSETLLTLIDFFNSLDKKQSTELQNDLIQLTRLDTVPGNQNLSTKLSNELKTFYQKLDKYDEDAQVTGISNVFFKWSTDTTYTQHIYRFLLALLAGGIGGIVSIFTRIDDIEKQNSNSPFLLGLLQPLIGATFSIVVMLVLSTPAVEVIKILPQELYLRPDIQTSPQQPNATLKSKDLDSREVYLILIVGFIVGFSERFAKNAFNSISRNP